MKNLILFDSEEHNTLLPLTYTKPVAQLRVGALKIYEKWEIWLNGKASFYTQPYLNELFPAEQTDDNLFILGGLLPTAELVEAISQLDSESCLKQNGIILAAKGAALNVITHPDKESDFKGEVTIIRRPWDIFRHNGNQIKEDLKLIKPEVSEHNLEHTRIIGAHSDLFIHPTAKVLATSLNTTNGPIYIGAHAEIMEGAAVRGPFYLGEYSVVKMGAKIYGDTSVGPYCKVGGEIANSVIQGYSNKGHDGYLGNSVLGEWCNLGADTNTSNLKNNYSEVRVWDYATQSAINTNLTFCGLIMGDHSKTGINTMLNTGSLVGVGSNIFGANFPPKFIPSFSWGSGSEFVEHDFEKFCYSAERVMDRRNVKVTPDYKQMMVHVFKESMKYRS